MTSLLRTALLRNRLPALFRSSKSAPAAIYPLTTTDGVEQRELVNRLIGSEGCVGEHGAMALMSLYPKDF